LESMSAVLVRSTNWYGARGPSSALEVDNGTDVRYLDRRSDLLVVLKGESVPAGLTDYWKIRRRAVKSMSDAIREDVQRRGYHDRSLITARRTSHCRISEAS
jgi:hypothetical protein